MGIIQRFLKLLPLNWFAVGALTLSIVASAVAAMFGDVQAVITAVQANIYLQTTSGGYLDLWVYDFFGPDLLRGAGESDTAYIARVQGSLLAPACTREAITNAITTQTGYEPTVVEPWRPSDTGAYGVLGGYGEFGTWTDYLPYQAFLTITVPSSVSGVPEIAGYGAGPGGYGVASMLYYEEIVTTSSLVAQNVYDLIERLKVYGTLIWVRLINA